MQFTKPIVTIMVTMANIVLICSSRAFGAPSKTANHCVQIFSQVKDFSPRLTELEYQNVQVKHTPSPGISSPILEEARQLKLYKDFKYLSDLRKRDLTTRQIKDAIKRSKEIAQHSPNNYRKVYLLNLIHELYEPGPNLLIIHTDLVAPKWQRVSQLDSSRNRVIQYIESLWPELIKKTPVQSDNSLIPLPYPVIIPGARFQESYYWDSYFGIKALLQTNRWDLAAMQVENFLFMLQNYNIIPNGMRDYYLTRSQPPVIASMAREVIEAALKKGMPRKKLEKWLRKKAYPLIKQDYENFWMNPNTRFDVRTNLNHHWDAKNKPREERHASDAEEKLGVTYRDVRAEAESGKDFTDAFEGEATQVAPVLLNSVLYKAENDLKWMADFIGDKKGAIYFLKQAERRKIAINTYLWSEQDQAYMDFHLNRNKKMSMLTADTFAPLWAELASPKQAAGVYRTLNELEVAGGIVASNKNSGKQWDSPFGWAPQQYFAIEGLRKYSYLTASIRIAKKWTSAIEKIFDDTGAILEKIDAIHVQAPDEDGKRYETQKGFLWTNAIYIWAITDVLGNKLKP